MARGLAFTVGLTVLIALVLVHPTCCATTAMVNLNCNASSCGNIHSISFPFRLKTDPENCGDPRYELSCENNHTVLPYLFELFGGKYFVQEISYNNYTIRIVDSGLHKDNYFSFTPTYSSFRYNLNFYSPYYTYLRKGKKVNYRDLELSRSLVLMSCEKPVNSPLYLDTSTCSFNDKSSSISESKRYRYVKVGRTKVSEVEESCKVEKMFRTSWPINNDDQISPVQTSTMNWYMVLSFHGSKVYVKVIAEETAIVATSMTRTMFNASSTLLKDCFTVSDVHSEICVFFLLLMQQHIIHTKIFLSSYH